MESVVREGDESQENPVAKLLKNKKVRAMMAQNSKVKEMMSVGQQLTNNTLNKVVHEAQTVLSSKSLEDLSHKSGKQVPGMQKLNQLPQEERAAASQNILETAKKSMKEFYVKQLQAHVQSATSGGLTSDHPFVQAYNQAISKIKGM
jgi:hypothetical protein